MTLSPTDYRAWRAEARDRDLAYAEGYRAGLADGRHRDGLVVLGIVGALLVAARRLRVHPLVLTVLAVAFTPAIIAVVAVKMTVRHHRRHRHWPRTLAYGVSWLVGLGLVVLAVASASVWPLVGLGFLVLAWTAGPSLVRFARRHRGRGRGPGTDGTLDPPWPPPRGPSSETEATATPYRVVFTSKAQHLEQRRYADGTITTVDTVSGEVLPDPFGPFTGPSTRQQARAATR